MPEDQVILLGGTPLEDDAVIGQCGISDLTTLEVAARMLGGKYGAPRTTCGRGGGGRYQSDGSWVEACWVAKRPATALPQVIRSQDFAQLKECGE